MSDLSYRAYCPAPHILTLEVSWRYKSKTHNRMVDIASPVEKHVKPAIAMLKASLPTPADFDSGAFDKLIYAYEQGVLA